MANKGWVLVQHKSKTFVWKGDSDFAAILPQIGYRLADDELPWWVNAKSGCVAVLVATPWEEDDNCLTVQIWRESDCSPLRIDDYLPMQRPGKFRQAHLSRKLEQEEKS